MGLGFCVNNRDSDIERPDQLEIVGVHVENANRLQVLTPSFDYTAKLDIALERRHCRETFSEPTCENTGFRANLENGGSHRKVQSLEKKRPIWREIPDRFS